MPYTHKQLQAIQETGTNILVSAGAGSGKTTVLSARVMRILKQGHSISNMLILTFTNNAAHNMREKIKADIKKSLKEFPQLKKQYDLVDTADILTFDAYNQKLLKRYFYRLNISRDFSIVDSSLLNVELTKIIRQRFDELYSAENQTFLNILKKYTVKKDDDIFNLILSIVKEEQKLPDWEKDLNNKISDPYLSGAIVDRAYQLAVKSIKDIIKHFLDAFNFCDDDDPAYGVVKEKTLFAFANYSDISTIEDAGQMYQSWEELRLIKKRKDSDFKERYDSAKKGFKGALKNMLSAFPSKNQTTSILNQKKADTIFIYSLARDCLERFNEYKRQNQVYDFCDIANYALQLLKENEDICREVRDSYYEIMVDEYQDNSDLQEEFLRLIGNNNLFLVGDVKQSIYRFRNSNPTYFMRRYNMYQHGDGGILIDMNDNFRSSPSVISDINNIFSRIMFADFGGAEYASSHQIKAGNQQIAKIDTLRTKQFNYSYGKSNSPVAKFEAQIICEDIIKRVESKELVGIDQHEAKFSDFCLLCDRGSKFEEIAKVFKSYKIPLNVETNKEVSDQMIVLLIRSLFAMYSCVYKKDFTSDAFRHALLSIDRSPFCKYSQSKLNHIFLTGDYSSDPTVSLMKDICQMSAGQDVKSIFLLMLSKFRVYEAIKDFVSPSATFQFLQAYIQIIDSMARLRYTPQDVINYFQTLRKDKIQVQLSINSASSNSVILTNIHKSKGLEYPIIYYIGLGSKYRINQYPRGFFYSQFTGIVLPFIKEEFDEVDGEPINISNPLLEVYKMIENSQDAQEKVRLLYVGLTRAKYQMIFVEPYKKFNPGSLSLDQCKSFLDLLNCAEFVGNIKTFTKDDICQECYHTPQLANKKLPINFNYVKINPSYDDHKKTASIRESGNAAKEILEFGTYVHKVMETIDLKHPDLTYIKDDKIRMMAENFLNSELIKNYSSYEAYHEYEYFDKDFNTFGSVDLLLIGSNDTIIIDYKLKNISDEKYRDQLLAYQRNMERLFHQPAHGYLYSLVDSTYKKIC